LGLEWHPDASLSFNAGYAQSYKAPSLPDLHSPVVISPLNAITDPQTGETVIVQTMAGGNSSLRPLSGVSHTLGMTYQNRGFPAPKLFAMYWRIKERDAIQSVFPQFIVDHEREFPDRVTRGVDGAITSVNSTRVNFGSYTVSGLDYGLTYPLFAKLAECTASIVMTQTLRYDQQLVPGDAVVDAVGFAQSSGAWAPRWKGRAAFDWSQRRYGFHLATRYTGGYRDYDGVHELSDFWITDLNLRYDIGQTLSGASAAWKDSYIEAGGVNVFNRTPSFSTFGSGFVGYDPGQADIRGRLLYAKLGFKW
jgi:iron complex outermembrane receptor protein